MAQDWLAEVRRGGDPVGAKAEARKALTTKALCKKFMDDSSKKPDRPSTQAGYQGVIDRNIIPLLIIDFIQDNIRHGMPLGEAGREAGAVCLRPILLTMLAINFGSAIMVTDRVFGGLAISLIFGTVASTALTVFAVPLLYELHAKRHEAPAAKGALCARATTTHHRLAVAKPAGHGPARRFTIGSPARCAWRYWRR